MTTVLTDSLRDFIDAHDVGVLGVKRNDGSIHQSVVYHLRDRDTLLITTEPSRLKGKSIAREGRASYCIQGRDRPYPAISVEGPARLLTEGIGELTRRLFSKIFGQEQDPMTDDAVRAMNRTIIELTIERVYSISYLEA